MDEWKIIYDSTPCYFFSFSNDGIITRVNSTLLEHLDYSAAEVIGVKKLEDLLTVGSRIFFQTHFYPLIKMQGRANEIFLSFKANSGKELPVLLNVILSGSREAHEIHCGGMQISQRNRFEKELLEAKNVAEKALLENDELVRLKQQLEANQQLLERQLQHVKRINSEHYQIDKVLSHDLQEPLRKINLFTSIILETNDVAEPVAEKLVKISKSSDKIRNLIDSMQRFHLLDYKPFVLDAHDLVSIINKAQIRADANCEIIYEGTPFPVVTGDVELLKSLFQELLTNSVKFAKPDISPVIVITCETVMHNIFREIDSKYKFEEFVRITYIDNGIGFDHMYSLQIFELFKKLHVNDGLGIGMSYCKKIIDLHQGFINVVSQPGVGTTFTILLPK